MHKKYITAAPAATTHTTSTYHINCVCIYYDVGWFLFFQNAVCLAMVLHKKEKKKVVTWLEGIICSLFSFLHIHRKHFFPLLFLFNDNQGWWLWWDEFLFSTMIMMMNKRGNKRIYKKYCVQLRWIAVEKEKERMWG